MLIDVNLLISYKLATIYKQITTKQRKETRDL